MNKNILLFFMGLLLCLPGQSFGERMTDNWKLTGYTRYRDAIFADMARLGAPAPGKTAVWIKIAPSKRSRYLRIINDYLASVHKQGRGFKSIEILCEFDCAKHHVRFLNFVYLDDNRHVIHEAAETHPLWMQINPGGIWHPVEKALCN